MSSPQQLLHECGLILAFLQQNKHISVPATINPASAGRTEMQHVTDSQQRSSSVRTVFFDVMNDAHPDTQRKGCRLKISQWKKSNHAFPPPHLTWKSDEDPRHTMHPGLMLNSSLRKTKIRKSHRPNSAWWELGGNTDWTKWGYTQVKQHAS